MLRRIIVSLPHGVPMPKYQLFQRVRFAHQEPATVGTIIGLSYFSPKFQEIEECQSLGWEYVVDSELEPRWKELEPVTYVPEDAIAEVLS